MAQILSFGIDRTYLDERAIILSKAGFRVSSAEQKGEALRLARLSPPQLVIFGHKVPARLRQSLALSFKEMKEDMRVVFVYAGERPEGEPADAFVSFQAAPEELLNTVERLLRNGE
jgi:DNA-binding response OmpR family regulator